MDCSPVAIRRRSLSHAEKYLQDLNYYERYYDGRGSICKFTRTKGYEIPRNRAIVDTMFLNLGEPTSMNLHISSEIQEYLSREEYFRYALCRVLGIIEDRLRTIDRPYIVEVKLEIDLFDPKGEHSDITVRIKEKDYKRILDLWDDVGSSVGSFLKSLRDGSTMPEAAADRLYDFINIIFAPDI